MTGKAPRSSQSGDLAGVRLELDVEAVGGGGVCIARSEGRVVFVRHALPGERVTAVVTSGTAGSRFLRADAVEVLRASPDRVEPPCPYARPGRCGGCDWQHVSLPAQRRLKSEVIAEHFRRLAGLDVRVEVEPVPGDDDGLGWRTRVGFAVDRGGQVGLRRYRSHEIEPIDRCLIASPGVTEVGAERRRWPGSAGVEVLAAPRTGDKAVVVTPADGSGPPHVPPLDAAVSVFRRSGDGAVTSLRGRRALREEAAGRRWRVSGSGFWQIHPGAADALVAAALDLARPAPGETALDLYCGVGLFAGALAPALGEAGRVHAVEGNRSAAADAAHNLRDLPNVSVHRGAVDDQLAKLPLAAADLVVLDPPRSGAGPAVCRRVAGLGPRAVVYVACDPAALARDVATFAAAGYRLAALRALDLFPMTAHVECVALLVPAPDGASG